MARSANQKLKLLLLRQYLERNSDEAHPVTTAQLLEYLASEGISAERKSIYSDLEALQSFGLDLIRVRDGNITCWYIGERVFQLPGAAAAGRQRAVLAVHYAQKVAGADRKA